MTPPDDTQLEELFVRYWDNALTERELAVLAALLRADPIARARFRMLCLHAVAAVEQTAVARTDNRPVPTEARWSRRRVLRHLGAGLAAGVTGGLIGWRAWPAQAAGPRLTAVHGAVTPRTADGRIVPVGGVLPPGGIVATSGLDSAAELTYPDGSSLALVGDTAATLTGTGRRIILQRGHAFADIRPQLADQDPLTLTTVTAELTSRMGAMMSLGHIPRETEVGVLQGQVTVAAPDGVPLAVVQGGELLTVVAGGGSRKEPLPTTPEEFVLDLTRPLPAYWHVGFREETADGPVLCPELWPDPYHQLTEMYQIRSDKRWTRGFFRLQSDSILRVRYRVERPGAGQVVVCVRTDRPKGEYAGVMEWNGVFGRHGRPGKWQWLEVRAGDMRDNAEAPTVGPPWVGFLLIFNTYTADLGLRVAEYRVARPG